MSKPFQYLRENIDKIKFNIDKTKFDCDQKYIEEYKKTFDAVLIRMDKYFEKNGLYDTVDYQPIVERMLESRDIFSFQVEEVKDNSYAGIFNRYLNGSRRIAMNKDYMGQGVLTESILCHEFIHYLTLSPDVLTYTKDGDRYETQLPKYMDGYKTGGMKRNLTKKSVDGLEAGSALDGGFICEAFTELLKQNIYPKDECFGAYVAQTSLINLANNLLGTKVNEKDFLRGDLPNYIQALGRKNFQEFNGYCEKFQEKFSKNHMLNQKTDEDFLAAQDLLCRTVLKDIEENPEKYTAEDYIRVASTIKTMLPVMTDDPNRSNKYSTAIISAGNAITRVQKLNFEDKKKYNNLLNTTLNNTVKQKQQIFQIPSPYSGFAFKKTDEGVQLFFRGDKYTIKNFTDTQLSTTVMGNNRMKIVANQDGVYEITANAPNATPQVVKIIPNKTKPDELLVLDAKNKDVYKIDFNNDTKANNRKNQESVSMLNNYKQYDNVKTILKENADNKIYNVKKITAENGEEYLVANSNKDSVFYKITPDGYVRMDGVIKEPTSPETPINKKITTVNNKDMTQVSYKPTGSKTDETSLSFKLPDGTSFVRYYDETGVEHIGQQIPPSGNSQTPVIMEIKDPTLYSKGNELLADLVQTNSTNNNKGINKEVSDKEIEDNKRIKEEEKRIKDKEQVNDREERNKKIEDERKDKNLTKEEIDLRNKKIAEERERRVREEQQKKDRYTDAEDKLRKNGKVKEDFSVQDGNEELNVNEG